MANSMYLALFDIDGTLLDTNEFDEYCYLEAVRDRFIEKVEAAIKGGSFEISRIPGATTALSSLAENGWRIALATGGWRESSIVKLKAAGIDFEPNALFSCDDHFDRVGIIELGIERAKESTGVTAFDRIVYVGDAIWDLEACRKTGLPFLGIGKRFRLLLSKGATHALEDYSNRGAFLYAMTRCGIPT